MPVTKVCNLDKFWRWTEDVFGLEVAVEETVPLKELYETSKNIFKIICKYFFIFSNWPVHVGESLEDLEDNSSHLISGWSDDDVDDYL